MPSDLFFTGLSILPFELLKKTGAPVNKKMTAPGNSLILQQIKYNEKQLPFCLNFIKLKEFGLKTLGREVWDPLRPWENDGWGGKKNHANHDGLSENPGGGLFIRYGPLFVYSRKRPGGYRRKN
jgi:hypothetical protein